MKKPAQTVTQDNNSITAISVCGIKSICNEARLEIRPLTVLAGANSSGKSSAVQPLLLLKQTVEETYDPGPLLLDGPNVKFTNLDQLFSHKNQKNCKDVFKVGIEISNEAYLAIYFKKSGRTRGLEIEKMEFSDPKKITLYKEMSHNKIMEIFSTFENYQEFSKFSKDMGVKWTIERDRCFLTLRPIRLKEKSFAYPFVVDPTPKFDLNLRKIIHVPGLRGNPERAYNTSEVGQTFPGTFDNYVASVIAKWGTTKNIEAIKNLDDTLKLLGLTSKVEAKPISDTQVEIRVGRLLIPPKGKVGDMVNIADVGFGVSQVLPVIVALLVAQKGQLVYIEQPELHLHPNAQYALAKVLADAAKRGVRVVAETHSSILLLGIQTLVAKGELSPDLVKLHWFKRKKDGSTEISSADLDENGAFGEDWPEDFDEVSLKTESDYLDAVGKRIKA